MSIPTQRDPSTGGSGSEQVIGFMADSFRRLEDTVARGFETVNLQLSRLPEQYVARREFDRYRDETGQDLITAQQQHDRDIAEIKADAKDRLAQARTFRMWLIGIGAAVGGLVIQIITHH